jgi:hypothetical protein
MRRVTILVLAVGVAVASTGAELARAAGGAIIGALPGGKKGALIGTAAAGPERRGRNGGRALDKRQGSPSAEGCRVDAAAVVAGHGASQELSPWLMANG